MMTTKERIIKSSIELFNQHGLVNVRLQMIADGTNMSVGNLAYHYHSKEAIIDHIVGQLYEVLEPVTDEEKDLQGLMSFDTQLAIYYHILLSNSFFFTDIVELSRNFPKQYKSRQIITEKITSQIYNWLIKNENRGMLIPELRKGHYAIIAHTIWMIITFYLIRPIDHSSPVDSEKLFKKMVWSQVLPHLTDLGRAEFDLLIDSLLWESSDRIANE